MTAGRNEADLNGITQLGNQQTKYPQDYDPKVLETFPNKHPDNGTLVLARLPARALITYPPVSPFSRGTASPLKRGTRQAVAAWDIMGVIRTSRMELHIFGKTR